MKFMFTKIAFSWVFMFWDSSLILRNHEIFTLLRFHFVCVFLGLWCSFSVNLIDYDYDYDV